MRAGEGGVGGAPGHRNRNGSTAGAVYLFALHNSGGLSASLALTIEGEEPLAELGHASPSVEARCSRSRHWQRAQAATRCAAARCG